MVNQQVMLQTQTTFMIIYIYRGVFLHVNFQSAGHEPIHRTYTCRSFMLYYYCTTEILCVDNLFEYIYIYRHTRLTAYITVPEITVGRMRTTGFVQYIISYYMHMYVFMYDIKYILYSRCKLPRLTERL